MMRRGELAADGHFSPSSSITISTGSSGERTGFRFTLEICCSQSCSWLASISSLGGLWRYLLTCWSHIWVLFTEDSSLAGRMAEGLVAVEDDWLLSANLSSLSFLASWARRER